MHFELRDKFYKPLGNFGKEEQLRQDADAVERKLILDNLKACLADYSGDQTIDWFDYEMELQKGSSLYEVYVPGSVLLIELLSTVAIRSALTQENMSDAKLIRVTHSGKLEVYGNDGWRDLVALGYVTSRKALRVSMDILADIAKEAGGCLWADNIVIIDQWLQFHGFDVPKTVAQVRNLIGYFEFDCPEVDHFGNYWGQIITDDPSLAVLSAEQCAAIRQATAKLVGANERLLDKLYRETGRAVLTRDAAERIVQLVKHPVAQACARKLLEELDWFGAQSGQDASAEDLAQLLITAILLELDPFIGNARIRNSIAGLNVYAPTNVERSSSVVRKELETSLHTKCLVNPVLVPMASHLLLAEIAPEFLVKGVPSSLMMGSVGWVSFCRGVVLAEAVRKGASRVMTYAQIMAYADLEPVSEPLKHLRDLAMIDPIVDWALINGVVTTQELTHAEKETTERAITVFQKYAENFTHLARVYACSMPSREDIARAAVNKAAPACDFLEEKIIYQQPGLYASPTAMSMVELHMSGDLVTGDWDLRGVFPDNQISSTPNLHAAVTNDKRPTFYDPSIVSIHSRYPNLRQLAPNNHEFHLQLRNYLGNLNSAVATNVKLALSHMLPFDLETFLKGKITFFTLRSAAVETSSRPWGGPLTLEADYETQQSKDAVTGRFGIVMYASHGSSFACYELFTLRGELRRNITLGALITKAGKLQGAARTNFNGDLVAKQVPTPLESLPITLREYTHGFSEADSASSMAIIEKLGELPAPAKSTLRQQSVFKNFDNPQIIRIAEFIVNNRPIITFDEFKEVATVPTTLERQRTKGEETAKYIVDLVVPFKKCIEDLSSGEHDKMVDGVYGCVMDAIALGGAFVGAGAKALSISSKAISLTSKAARLTKLAFATSVSIFNPVDGVPTALFGAGKLVHKGALHFTRKTQEILGLAQSQLRKLNGSHKTYDLVRAAKSADTTGQGTWRPLGATETFVVVAARNNLQWYALDRLGKPWGPKLSNFIFMAPVRLRRSVKSLPVSYTRQFIEQSLPLARTKIENAINVLTSHDFTKERNAIIKVLLGSDSSAAFERVLNYLRVVRADFAGLSISNIFLDPLKNTNNIAAFNMDAYKQWKDAKDQSDTKFIEIYTPNLNKHFIGLGFNHDVVADDLIHEVFHGAAQADDVSYARDAGRNGERGQLLDVAALLNLASGRLPVTDEGRACHASSKAFENADSLAVTTSLLSQLYTDKGSYELNMSTLRGALEANPGSAIDEPVLITLNNSIAPKPAS